MTLPHLSPPMAGLAFACCAAVLLWLLSLRRKDASIAALFWGPGIAGVADIGALMSHGGGERASAGLFLVNLWAVRLTAHLFARHRGEDRRYAAMRRQYGPHWWLWSLVQVFLLQAILIWFVPAPILAVMMAGARPMTPLAYAGVAVAALGLLWEGLADNQLARFRADPANAGKVLERGLWAWSRHPNYFGESLMWWGFFLLGFSAVHQWWLILSPLLVTVLLIYVTGIPALEDGIDRRRSGYDAYRARVSGFLPLPPRMPGPRRH